MSGMDIGGVAGGGGPAGGGKSSFDDLLADAAKGKAPIAVQSEAVDPGIARSQTNTTPGIAMPDDKDFLVVDEVSVETATDGSEIAVVSGEAVTADQAETIAAKGGSVVPLFEPRQANRAISGSMFASMLLDQRNGVLPNPFSMMRIPERPAAPAQASSVQSVAAPAPVAAVAPPETQGQALPDAPGTDAIAEGKEISRLEAAISVLIEKLEGMMKSLRILVGTLARQQGGASVTDIPPASDASRLKD